MPSSMVPKVPPSRCLNLHNPVQETADEIPYEKVDQIIDVGNAESCGDETIKAILFNAGDNMLSHGGNIPEIERNRLPRPSSLFKITTAGSFKSTSPGSGMGLFFIWQALKLLNVSDLEVGAEEHGAQVRDQNPSVVVPSRQEHLIVFSSGGEEHTHRTQAKRAEPDLR